MQHETQLELVREIFRHLDAGTTARADDVTRNPTRVYTDPGILHREKEILFGGAYPLFAGFSCQIRETGDYLADDSSGLPILVVRNEEGGLSGLVNVCRHRGSRVATEACGRTARRFVCPYHAWSYDLHGRLAGVPDKKSFEGLDFDAHGLVKVPVVEKYGMIWVRPTPGSTEPIDIDSALAGLGPELGSYGCERYHFYETRVMRHAINWKIAIDTFLEPYHFAYLHRETVGPIFVPNLCLFHPFGPNLRETLPRKSIVALRDLPEREWDLITHTAIVYVLFPNAVFVVQADHIEMWRIFPDGDRVDRTVIYLDFFIPEPATTDSAHRHWERNLDLTVRTVEEEDFPTGETIQKGFAAGIQDHLTYGRNEPALAHFETSVARALA